VAPWRCPDCDRQFRRAGQSHECEPALSLEEYFATDPGHERPVFDAVMAHLDSVGPVHVEPVAVGIFLKKSQGFAELRTRDKWVALSFSLGRQVEHPTIVRKVIRYRGRYHHVANLRTPEDFDDQLREWLTEAYLESPE
jgi:hypothetical protein